MLMKKLLIIFLIIINLFFCVYADENEDVLENLADSYSEKIEQALDDVNFDEMLSADFEKEYPEFNAEKIFKNSIYGKKLFSVKEVFKTLFEYFFFEIKFVAKTMVVIFAASILGSFFLNLRNSADNDGISSCGFFCIYIIVIGMLSAVFSELSQMVINSVNNLSVFTKSMLPVMFSTLYSTGAITSATVMQSLLSGGIHFFIEVISKILVPVIMLSFSVCAVSSLSEKINADKFAVFLMKTVRWGLTVILIIFIFMLRIQSTTTAAVDGLSIRLTKYAATSLIPFVGGILSESVGTVINCSVLIKNSVGVFGIIAVLYLSFMPLVKLWASLIVLRFSASVMQPIAEERIIKCLTNSADLTALLLSVISAAAVMFILIISILINAGNSVFMLSK